MTHSATVHSRSVRTLLLALLLALLATALCAAPAMAGPPDPTLSVAELETKLAAGPLNGYFLTVVGGQSQDPIQIPASVISVVPNQTIDGALILFEASGPVIEKAGGVAYGMSGSPLYVDDGGTYKLVGAVSYGPLGASAVAMATPIEYMAAMQSDFPPQPTTLSLPEPLAAGGGLVSKVRLAPNRRAARATRPGPDTLVMAPLATVTIGGLPAKSPAFKKAAARLAKLGLDALPGGATRAGGGEFATPFVPGASLAAMIVSGDGWVGGFGTTTYVDGDVVVGFGHPLIGGGEAGFDLANAVVGGIWPGILGPEKIVAPGALAGTITQDRTCGIAGRLDALAPQVPITSTITFAGRTITSHSAMPQWAIDSYDWSWYADIAPWVAMMMASRQEYLVGSATTTTEVKLSDGTTDYAVRLENVWDDDWDVISWCTSDLDEILYSLTPNYYGVAPAMITEVNFSAELSPQRRFAEIADVAVPGGLKVGENTVTTTLYRYGDPQPQTVSTTLTIPPGMVKTGYLSVSGYGWYGYEDEWYYDEWYGLGGPQSVAEIVAGLQASPRNSDLQVSFEPSSPIILPPPASDPIIDQVTVTTPTSSDLRGYVYKRTGTVRLYAPSVVRRGASVRVRGEITPVAGHTSVSIYKHVAGQTGRRLVKTVTAAMDERSQATFSFWSGSLRRNTRFFAVWDGDSRSLGATTSRLIRVRVP